MIFLHQRIKIQPLPLFFYLQPSAFFYLHTITNHKITDPRITRNIFFLWNDKSQQRRRRGYWSRIRYRPSCTLRGVRERVRACVREHVASLGHSDGAGGIRGRVRALRSVSRTEGRREKIPCLYIISVSVFIGGIPFGRTLSEFKEEKKSI